MLFATFLLLAESDPISGGAGWVGAGLLGAVLCWLLLKHLPEKDAQIERLVERGMKLGNEARADFKDALKSVIDHCNQESARSADTVVKAVGNLEDTIRKTHKLIS